MAPKFAADTLEFYEDALTGKGAIGLSLSSFRNLINFIKDKKAIISDVEVYELQGEIEFIRTDLAIWPAVNPTYDWKQKLEGMDAEISRFLMQINTEGGDFYFNVWLDDNT